MLSLERENYMQRFAGLVSGERIRCGAVLELCREELAQLCPRQPQEGWLRCAFDFARRQLFPEQVPSSDGGAGAVFFLSVLQVLFTVQREILPFDPMYDFAFISGEELEQSPGAALYEQMLRLWKREYIYEMMRLGLEVTPFRALEHIAGVHHIAITMGRGAEGGRGARGPGSGIRAAPPGTTSASSAADPGSGCRISITIIPICGSAAGGLRRRPMWRRTTPCGIWSRTICPPRRCC